MPDSTKGLASLLKGIDLNKILGSANKTLNFVKQAVPLYKQAKPIFGNFKTFLNMYGEVKRDSQKEEVILPPMPVGVSNQIKDNVNNRRSNNLDTLTFFQ